MIIPAFMLGGLIIAATAGCLTGPALLHPHDDDIVKKETAACDIVVVVVVVSWPAVLLGSIACIFGTLTIMSVMVLCGVIVSKIGLAVLRSTYNFLCDANAKPNFNRLTNGVATTKKSI